MVSGSRGGREGGEARAGEGRAAAEKLEALTGLGGGERHRPEVPWPGDRGWGHGHSSPKEVRGCCGG